MMAIGTTLSICWLETQSPWESPWETKGQWGGHTRPMEEERKGRMDHQNEFVKKWRLHVQLGDAGGSSKTIRRAAGHFTLK